jgi:transcriptional regulator with XRE-family HTH domain
MQAPSRPSPAPRDSCPYTAPVPRELTKPRPKQGARLATLRKAAGLSQYDLARLVGVPQPNIAYWEQSEKPPRSDVLPAMAEALGVSVEELLSVSSDRAPARKAGRLTGRARQVFEQVAHLPRRQQEKIADFVAAYVKQYEQDRQRS